jgi:hypothetical protein
MPAFWSTNWTGTPQLHKIVNVDDGRTHYFFDQAPKARTIEESGFDEDHPGLTRTRQLTGDDGGPSYEDGGYYSGTDINQVRQEWQRQFPGVAFPDASTATLGAGINAQGNGIPGQFSGNEYTERGNSGHGSWLDQQGTEIMGNALFGAAGYFGGPVATGLMSYGLGGDTSAESQRDLRAGGIGALAANIFGGSGDSSINNSTGSDTLKGGTGTDTIAEGNNVGDYGDFGDLYSNYDSTDYNLDNPDLYSTGVDQYGNPTGEYADSTFKGDTSNTNFGPSSSSNNGIQDFLKQYGPQLIKALSGAPGNNNGVKGGTATGSSGLVGSILQYLGTQRQRGIINAGTETAAGRADPFATQRPMYQDMLKQGYTDPNFLTNNPFFSGIRNNTINDVSRTMAARGYNMSGNETLGLGNELQNRSANFALPYLQGLGKLAGGDLSQGYAGNITAAGVGQSSSLVGSANAASGYGFSSVLDSLFGVGNAKGNGDKNVPNFLASF